MGAKKGQSWNEYFEECFEKVLDKLDHMDFNGEVKFNPVSYTHLTLPTILRV